MLDAPMMIVVGEMTVVVTVVPWFVIVTVVVEPSPATMTVVPSGRSVIVVGLMVPAGTVAGVAVATTVEVP